MRDLVALHGGAVVAHSAGIDQGTEMRVRLPLAERSPQDAPACEAPVDAPGARLQVLVVDDNRDAADSLASLLRALGAEVRAAYGGAEALDAFEQGAPDLLLLDVGMPEMGGCEVARRLRRHPRGAGVVLAALTGWGQAEDRRRTAEAGFDHHLVKPVALPALASLLLGIARPPRSPS